MHLVRIDTVSLDEGEAAVDLGQAPGDIVFLSFTDSDLAGIAAAHASAGPDAPTLRLAKLARLRHPMSVDLYVDSVIARARIVVIRCLGGLDYWRYGIERARAAAVANGVALAVLPGDDRPDPRLDAYATMPGLSADLDAYFRAGGPDNLRRMLGRLAAEIGRPVVVEPPEPLPRGFAWCPGCGPVPVETALAAAGSPTALLLVYRSAVLGGDTEPVAALAAALRSRGIGSAVVAVSSLKDPAALEPLRALLAARRPDIVVATTAFSAREDARFVLDAADCPILQGFTVGAPRAAWAASSRGLNAADLAMQVALPEFDGRLSGFPISFKEESPEIEGYVERRAVPDPECIAALADRAAAWVRLARRPRAERRLAMVLSDYPARGGRAGFAVGLDTGESARAIAADLAAAGYGVGPMPEADALMRALTEGEPTFAVPLDDYRAWLTTLPPEAREVLNARWGSPEDDPTLIDGAFRFRSAAGPLPRSGEGALSHEAGGIEIFLQPDRGRGGDRKAGYHDPDEPPSHAYLAFHLGLRGRFEALIHLGTHGTT